jgi:hypothetical protein
MPFRYGLAIIRIRNSTRINTDLDGFAQIKGKDAGYKIQDTG